MTSPTLTLWDSTVEPPENIGEVYTWNGYLHQGSIHSLLRYVDTHADRIRSKYLGFIHDLGEAQIHGKRLVDHLDLGDGLSLWWMSLLVEKSNWNSPIEDYIRLIALEEIICQQKPTSLKLVSANRNLNKVVNGLCKNLEIEYIWDKPPGKSIPLKGLREIIYGLPYPLQALAGFVRYMWIRWPFRKASRPIWNVGNNSLFFCSYFFNIDPGLAEKGQFHSSVWEGLKDLMENQRLSGNWLHHYYPHKIVPDSKTAMDWAECFNQRGSQEGVHAFIDSYWSGRIILRVLKNWIRLVFMSFRLKNVKRAFFLSDSYLSLWPLMKRDWYASIRGWVSIKNLLFIELFNKALSDLPHQKKGFYLCENIAWERALIHSWRKHGHGKLIAVAHGAGRFWDLRYFNDLRVVISSKPCSLPQADLTALYGKAAVSAYREVGYPEEAIVECEALRNGYLHGLESKSSLGKVGVGPIKVLILGEYGSSGTIKMLQLLEEAVPHITVSISYTVKPHPNYYVKATDYPSLNFTVIVEPLERILNDFDVVYSAMQTSAAVDAYIIGLPVVVRLDEAGLNQSPLCGKQGVCFVSTAMELAEALQVSSQGGASNPDREGFYFIDPELPRWKKMLSTMPD